MKVWLDPLMQPWVLARERGVPERLAPLRRGWGQFAYIFCLRAYSMIKLIEVLLYSQIFRHYPSRKSEDISTIPTSHFPPQISLLYFCKKHISIKEQLCYAMFKNYFVSLVHPVKRSLKSFLKSDF